MNYGAVSKVIGAILMVEAAFMSPSLIYAYVNNESALNSFIITIGLCLILGVALTKMSAKSMKLYPKDGLFIVCIGWVLVSALGALPLYLTSSVPTYIDAFFETVSGFTTTGSTIIQNIENVEKSLVLWRSVTHWIGGMGILVFTLALLPRFGNEGFKIFKAETPGPVAGKVEPKLKDTAKFLYSVYLLISIILFVLLTISGMDVFDAIVHTLGVVGTGGFSSHGDSLASYNSKPQILYIMSLFMVLCGTNFSLYYLLFKKRFKDIFKDDEFRTFYGIILFSILCICLNLIISRSESIGMALQSATFQVTSIVTTSGFASVDYDLWPTFSKFILLMLMFMGSSAGSTAGGMKVIRLVVMGKIIRREILRIMHPNAVVPIKVNGKKVQESVVMGIVGFLGIYFIILIVSVGIVSLSEVDYITALSSVVTCLSNVGPGFNLVGPSLTFAEFSSPLKLLFSSLMLLGRLEFFTVIALIMPNSWVYKYEV